MDQLKAANDGFSLIEVMIVLVIIGALMLVALPGYQDSMRKSDRADGMRDLMELTSRQERFYAQNSRYTDDIGTEDGLNFPGADTSAQCTVTPEEGTVISSECHYTISVEACSDDEEEEGDFNRCYVLVAEPIGKQQKDACGALTVNSLGQRSHSGSPGNDDLNCW